MSTWNILIAEEMEKIANAKHKAKEERDAKVKRASRTWERKPFTIPTKNKFEKWTDIKGYDGWYKVSTAGRIWSAYTGKFMKPVEHPYSGYYKIRLKHSPESKKVDTLYLHRIVALHFIDNPENKPEVNHNDGNKKNCTVYNLAWMTREENMRHAQMHGLGNVKLKPIEAQSIFYLAWASDMNQDEIGALYGVTRGVVSAIKNRQAWEFCTDSEVQASMGLFE